GEEVRRHAERVPDRLPRAGDLRIEALRRDRRQVRMRDAVRIDLPARGEHAARLPTRHRAARPEPPPPAAEPARPALPAHRPHARRARRGGARYGEQRGEQRRRSPRPGSRVARHARPSIACAYPTITVPRIPWEWTWNVHT